MARVKTGPAKRARHNKVLDSAKGYKQARSSRYKVAQEAVLHAGQYAFVGRRLRRRDFRRFWIQRINAGLTVIENGPSYSVLMNLLKVNKIELNRKMLSELAVNDFPAFKQIVDQVYGK